MIWGHRTALLSARIIGTLAQKTDRLHRERCSNNVRYIFPDRPENWRMEIVKNVFQHGVTCAYEFIRLSLLCTDARKLIEIQNIEYLQSALEGKRGIVGLTAHFGNASILPFVLDKLPADCSIIVRRASSRGQWVANSYRRFREKALLTRAHFAQIPGDINGAREACKRLRQGRFVIVLADATWGTATVPVLVLGRTIEVSRAPAWLARRTGAILLPFFTFRRIDGTHILRFHEPINWDSSRRNDSSDRIVMQQYAGLLEGYVERQPDQWLWIYVAHAGSPGRPTP